MPKGQYGPYGDTFAQCVAAVSSWSDNPEGFCNWQHQQVMGVSPGGEERKDAAPVPAGVLHRSRCPKCDQLIPILNRGGGTFAPHPRADGAAACDHSGASWAKPAPAPRNDGKRRVGRFDHFDASMLKPAERDGNGFLRCEGRIGRTGVQIYMNADGTIRRELRLPEEVFKQKSIDSFKQVPVTNLHPQRLLDETTARQHAIGNLGENIRRDGKWMVAPILIYDGDAIRDAEAGRRQLSNGYDCELEIRSGFWNEAEERIDDQGEPFDAIQREIEGNHCALVDAARAGENATLRLDQMDDGAAYMVASLQQPTAEKTNMPLQILVSGKRFDASDNHAQALQAEIDSAIASAVKAGETATGAERSRADALDKEKQTLAGKLTSLQAKIDAAKARRDAAAKKMIECDECDGEGEVKGKEGKMVKCEGCDGEGKYAAGNDGDGDDDDDENEDKKKDKAKRDKKRADSRRRVFDRAVAERVALEVKARGILGPEAKLDGLDANGVMVEVVKKLDGVEKLDREDPPYVKARFDIAIARVDAGGTAPAPSEADLARARALRADAGGNGNGGQGAGDGKKPRHDTSTQRGAEAAYNERQSNAYKGGN